MVYPIKYIPYGERSILLQWPPRIDTDILKDIIGFKEKILGNPDEDIVYVNTSYNSLIIFYKAAVSNVDERLHSLRVLYKSDQPPVSKMPARLWKIPVCYNSSFSPDMELLCSEKHLSAEEIIRLHTRPTYTLYFIGFLPGFMYLGGLDKKLHFPRKNTPRSTIVQGAVGIGGGQTGIYPSKSPGGWNIIGNSPLCFFNSLHPNPCFARAGDSVNFYSIDINQYNGIKRAVEKNEFELEFQIVHD